MVDAKSRSLTDSIGLLSIRAVVGVVFMFHGAQKLFGYFDGPGIQGFAAGLEKMQIPQPLVNAYLAGGAEFFGGALLVLGLFTRLASIPLLITMLVAVFVAHREAFSLKNGGMEYALTLACVVAGIGLLGPGCLSFDALFGKKKSVD